MGGNPFINRFNLKNAISCLKSVGERMKRDKTSLFIFPEGTRQRSNIAKLGGFKKGGFWVAGHDFKIVPIVLGLQYPLYNENDREFNSGTIFYKVLDGIKRLENEDVDEYCDRVRRIMELEYQNMPQAIIE